MSNNKKVKILKKYKQIDKNSAIVIIDVFRATSTMYYLFDKGVKKIFPTDSVESAKKLKNRIKNTILLGENQGIKPNSFKYNNSPNEILNKKITNNIIMSTTSGTKAIKYYKNNDVYIGSLLNAKSLTKYLNSKDYKIIYILPTNNRDKKIYNEDYICAKYLYSLIKKRKYKIKNKINKLKSNKNLRFFKVDLQDRFPKNDFYLCTNLNIFNFILIYKNEYIERII